jgi:SdpC family antimicrobial peptide
VALLPSNNRHFMKAKSFTIRIVTVSILSISLLGIPRPAFAQSSQSFTGEQIFRGILFGEPPVSQLFPEIWAGDAARQSLDTKDKIIAVNELKEGVVAEIISSDPAFLSYFGQEMQSGDHLRVQAALREASQRMFAAMQSLEYLDSEGNPEPNTLIFVFGAVAVVLAVALAGFGFQIVYYYYYYAVTVYQRYANSPETTEEESLLYLETLINSMAEKLAIQ